MNRAILNTYRAVSLLAILPFLLNCVQKGKSLQKKEEISFHYISQASYDSGSQKFKWSPVTKLSTERSPGNVKCMIDKDSINMNYGGSSIDTFFKVALSAEDLIRNKKKIKNFDFLGCFDRRDPDGAGLDFLFYKNPLNELIIILKDNPANIIGIIYYPLTTSNSLASVVDYPSFMNGTPSNHVKIEMHLNTH